MWVQLPGFKENKPKGWRILADLLFVVSRFVGKGASTYIHAVFQKRQPSILGSSNRMAGSEESHLPTPLVGSNPSKLLVLTFMYQRISCRDFVVHFLGYTQTC